MNNVPTIGQLRTRVRFEINDPTQLGAGKQDSYSELLTCWGKLEEGTGRMMVDGGAPVLFSRYTLYVRLQDVLTLAKSASWADPVFNPLN